MTEAIPISKKGARIYCNSVEESAFQIFGKISIKTKAAIRSISCYMAAKKKPIRTKYIKKLSALDHYVRISR